MDNPLASYFDTTAWDPRDAISGGSRMIPVSTPRGEIRIWTRRTGHNPRLKVLLHGGPGATSELYESFDTWFPRAGIEYYHYDHDGPWPPALDGGAAAAGPLPALPRRQPPVAVR